MALLVWFTLLGFFTAHSVAQKPRPCRSPPLLQGSLSVVSQTETFEALAKYKYDAFGQRVRFGEFGQYQNKSFHLDVLLLYKEAVMYNINQHNKTCTKKELKSSFHPLEIPHDATLLGQVVLGSFSKPGAGLLVNSWVGEVPKQQAKYLLTFTEFGCLPISALYKDPKNGWITTRHILRQTSSSEPNRARLG
ncbi:ependymin-like 1 isoform X2 [Brachyhypopomus gauderio]|uniref:ependymin-like 1 isoform X2 n=1 Tax=Brachyhypopomus gauderio TaxID=698409 RepID=UPI0040422747